MLRFLRRQAQSSSEAEQNFLEFFFAADAVRIVGLFTVQATSVVVYSRLVVGYYVDYYVHIKKSKGSVNLGRIHCMNR